MENSKKTLKFRFERTIPAPPGEVFDAWVNPRIPGNPWNAAEKFILDAKVDGLFYWILKGTGATASNSARLDVAKYLGARVDSYPDLQETGRRHAHDPGAFRIMNWQGGMRKDGTTFWEFFASNLEMAHARDSAGMTPIRLQRNNATLRSAPEAIPELAIRSFKLSGALELKRIALISQRAQILQGAF